MTDADLEAWAQAIGPVGMTVPILQRLHQVEILRREKKISALEARFADAVTSLAEAVNERDGALDDVSKLEAQLVIARNEALEEAAKVLDRSVADWRLGALRQNAAATLAHEIRAMTAERQVPEVTPAESEENV